MRTSNNSYVCLRPSILGLAALSHNHFLSDSFICHSKYAIDTTRADSGFDYFQEAIRIRVNIKDV